MKNRSKIRIKSELYIFKRGLQNPTHLVLECSEYRADRVEAFEGLDNNQKSIGIPVQHEDR